ncbi:hypothetical protein ACFLW2_03485 [Chloroflexota bacterium]
MKRNSKKAMDATNAAMQLNIQTGEKISMENHIVRLASCIAGNLHLIATCPRCHSKTGGLLFTTVPMAFIGATTARCIDCGHTIDYYIDTMENRAWVMEAIEARTGDITR